MTVSNTKGWGWCLETAIETGHRNMKTRFFHWTVVAFVKAKWNECQQEGKVDPWISYEIVPFLENVIFQS